MSPEEKAALADWALYIVGVLGVVVAIVFNNYS
jgi:hypothetical protein